MKYFLIAGEASGDLHAGCLIKALREQDKNADFRFLGGDFMQEASGKQPVIHYKRMAFMAFAEVIRHLPEIVGNMKTARNAIRDFRPDAVVLIDYPSFNLKIAKYAFKLGIPVYYYISPKIWAWKEYRVRSIKKYIRAVYSILPFETAFYARHGYRVDYTGNPTVNEIAEAMKAVPDRQTLLGKNGISDPRPIVALLPGSRLGEIRNNLPLMYRAASRFPDHQPIVARAPNVDPEFYASVLGGTTPTLLSDSTYPLLANADAALVTSGTATLETAVIGTPQVVCYRANGSKWTYRLFERILKVPFVSLPNLIADRKVVAELLLHQCTEEAIAKELKPLLSDTPERSAMLEGYAQIRQRLGSDDSASATALCLINDLTALQRQK